MIFFGKNKKDNNEKCSAFDIAESCSLFPKHYCLQPRFPKDSVSLLFVQLSGSVG